MKRVDVKLYDIVLVQRDGYAHYGQILSRVTPTNTAMVRMVPGHPGTLREMSIDVLHETTISPGFVHYAVVQGIGSFPVDMLRREGAVPLNFDPDTKEFDRSFGTEEFMICKVSELREPNWNEDRWDTFGWQVFETHTEEIADEPQPL